ncbi:MAG: ABC transporter ATP-binding protein [Eubacteriales bacterium]|nr:ABC transporter ATP-binding protein [Eubacteriales bacterium]
MLQVEHLCKGFGRFRLEDISFKLPAGYIMGIIGENGSGKSTLLRCLLNIYKKDSGKVMICKENNCCVGFGENEYDLDKDEAGFKSEIAVVFEHSMYEEAMSGMDNARIVESVNAAFEMELFLKECEYWNINPKKKLKTLSKGMNMKFQMAMAIAASPKLLILDEPSANLDGESRKMFKKRLMDFVNDGTRSVLVSSHLTTDMEEIADYILYIHKGRVLMNDDKESLLDRYLIVSGEDYKIQLLPKKIIVGLEKNRLSTTALIEKSNIYKPDTALEVRRPRLEELMYYINHENENRISCTGDWKKKGCGYNVV